MKRLAAPTFTSLRHLHVPQIEVNTNIITCMKDGCDWKFVDGPGPGAQESFEAHLRGEQIRNQHSEVPTT